METNDAFSNRIDGGANTFGGQQLNQNLFQGPVNFSYGPDQALPERASTIPRTVNRRLYTGRREIAERLADAFNPDTRSQEEGVKVFVIIGLGGTGKSEICLKFAEDYSSRYWGRFWVDSSNPETASESYKSLGQQCNWVASKVDEVRWKLSSCGRRWLLVLDNADEPNMDLQDYIPTGGTGDVIITSRNAECSEHATVGAEPLDGLDDELSEELLLKVAGIQTSAYVVEAEAAKEVVKTLGRHTLALVQAGSYIKNGLCTLTEYPTIYSQQKKELMNYTKRQQKSSYNSVYATFEVSAKWLERESISESDDAQSSRDGLHLIHMLSFMSRTGPMQLIFAEAAQYADMIQKGVNKAEDDESSELAMGSYHIQQLPAFIPHNWRGSIGCVRWRKACNVLKRFSLVTITGADREEALTVHPLVHEWTKERQDANLRQQVWLNTACVLSLACGGNFCYAPIFETLIGHIKSCVGQDIQDYIWKMPRLAAWSVVHQLAWVVLIIREYDIFAVLNQAMKGLIVEESENDSMRIATSLIFAVAKLRKDRNREALQVLEEIVKIRELKLNEANPERLKSLHELAQAYKAYGRTVEAVKLLEHVVQIQESRLHQAHPRQLASQSALAVSYRANGQISEAIKMLKHVINVQVLETGEENINQSAEMPASFLQLQQLLAELYNVYRDLTERFPMLRNAAVINVLATDMMTPATMEMYEQLERFMILLEDITRG